MRRREKKKKANPPLGGNAPRAEAGRGQTTTYIPRWERSGARFSLEPASPTQGPDHWAPDRKNAPPRERERLTRSGGDTEPAQRRRSGGEGGVKPVVHPVGKPRSPGRPRRGRCPPPSRVFKAEEATAAGAACAPGCTQEPAHRAQAGGSGGGSAGTSPQDRPGSRHAPGQRQQPSRSLRWEATERERVSTYLAVQTAFVTPKNDRRTRAGRIRVLPRGPSGRGPVGDTQPKAFSPCPGAPRDIWSTP